MNNYKKIKEFLHTEYGVNPSNNLVGLILNGKSIRKISTNQLMDIIIQLAPAIKTIRYTLDGPSEAAYLFNLIFEIDYRVSKDKNLKEFYDFFIGNTYAYEYISILRCSIFIFRTFPQFDAYVYSQNRLLC